MKIDTKVFAGRLLDRDKLKYSSSGGAFTAISDLFLDEGNAVVCTGYDYENDRASFRLVISKEERDRCRGSLYIQSDPLDTWREALIWLRDNKEKNMVFFGVGCQCTSFQRFCELNHVNDQVTFVDIICHGSPSPLIWREYIKSVHDGRNLSNVNFRDKKTGWSRSIGTAQVDGQEVSLSKYRRVYSGLYTVRQCCSSCPYTTISRKSDITIGDFWHMENSMPDFVDEMGTSLFLIHTDVGLNVFERIKEKLDWRESNVSDCWQYNLERPTQHSVRRDEFWQDYRVKGIEFVMDKYGTISFAKRLKNKARKIFRGGYSLTLITEVNQVCCAYLHETRCAA